MLEKAKNEREEEQKEVVVGERNKGDETRLEPLR